MSAFSRHWQPPKVDRARFPVDEWGLTEAAFDESDLGVTETLFSVANGYLGLRGNYEEGRANAQQGTFISGLHETWRIHHAEEAFGFARVGQTMVNAPDAKTFRLYVDDEPLLLGSAELLDYRRNLDFRSGVLTRELVWRTPAGKRVRVRSTRMVSFMDRHLALMSYEVTLLGSHAPVVISSQLMNRQDGQEEFGVTRQAMGAEFEPRKANVLTGRVFQPQYFERAGNRLVLGYQVTNSRMTVACAADHFIDTDNDYTVSGEAGQDMARQTYRVHARPDVPIRITKVVSYHTSSGFPIAELVDRCSGTLRRVEEEGFEAQYRHQRDWLDAFWERSDVRVSGRPEIQQALRWNLFELAQASARSEELGIPAKGLTGSGYSGHYFWDTEVFVVPFLTYTSPQVARNALRFRYSMLPAARRRALDLNVAGALFPWRTINGEEASAYYAAGTAQYHIDADIACAVARYVTVTDDVDFLGREGVDIVVETARMWATLGFWRGVNGNQSFHVHGVTGPDEYTTVVNNNLFTNVMAKFNLRYAVHAVRLLQEHYPDVWARANQRLHVEELEVLGWDRAADCMRLPYNEHFGIHPQDEQFLDREVWDLDHTPEEKRPLLLHYHPLVIYRFQVIKQADVVLALYLRSHEFTAAEKLADFEYYDPITTGDSTLSGGVQSIVAAEVGYQELAYQYFMDSLFVDLANLHRNTDDGVHVASAGGVWNSVVSGFGGLRDDDGVLRFDPRLPEEWSVLSFPLTWRGVRVRFTVARDVFKAQVEHVDDGAGTDDAGGEVTFEVRGESVTVRAGEPVTVRLADQGPRRPGKPQLRDLSDFRREDGTLVTASIPIQRTVPGSK